MAQKQFENVPRSERAAVFLRGALGDCLLTVPLLAALTGSGGVRGLSLIGPAGPMSVMGWLPFVAETRDHDRPEWTVLYEDDPDPETDAARFLVDHAQAVVFSRRNDDPVAGGLIKLGLNPVIVVPSRPPESGGIHVVDHMFEQTGTAGPPPFVRLEPDDEAQSEAASLLGSLGLTPGRFWVVQPGSGSVMKNWPMDRWLETARLVRERSGLEPLFLFGPAEAERSGFDAAEFRSISGLSISVAAGLIDRAACYAGNDSGVSHLAAGLGRPTLAMFGPTDPAEWAPRGPAARVLSHRKNDGQWQWPDASEAVTALLEMMNQG